MFSEAHDVSADGSVVVGIFGSAGVNEPFRWTAATGMVGLGAPLGPSGPGAAHGVTPDGSVVVGTSGDVAFLWDADHGMRSIQALLTDGAGIDLAGWDLRAAADVSADGTVVLGWGTNPDGFTEAWIADLSVPEPMSIVLVGSCLVGLAARHPRLRV